MVKEEKKGRQGGEMGIGEVESRRRAEVREEGKVMEVDAHGDGHVEDEVRTAS